MVLRMDGNQIVRCYVTAVHLIVIFLSKYLVQGQECTLEIHNVLMSFEHIFTKLWKACTSQENFSHIA